MPTLFHGLFLNAYNSYTIFPGATSQECNLFFLPGSTVHLFFLPHKDDCFVMMKEYSYEQIIFINRG